MLCLPDHLTLDNAPQVLQDLQAQIAAAPSAATAVDVDAGALREVDSVVLAVLLACRRGADARQQTFSVRRAPARLVDLADLYGVQELLALRAD